MTLSFFCRSGICATPAACEVDTCNAITMYALRLASEKPATCLDWNNNYGDDPDKCALFHAGRRGVAGDLRELGPHRRVVGREPCRLGDELGEIDRGHADAVPLENLLAVADRVEGTGPSPHGPEPHAPHSAHHAAHADEIGEVTGETRALQGGDVPARRGRCWSRTRG